MPTKAEIESRITRIYTVFKKTMPPIAIPYPSITVATQRTHRDARALFVARTGAAAIPANDQAVELIRGPKGSAIIVRKEQIKSLDHLYHALWAELGRFYISTAAIHPAETKEMEAGRDFWFTFAPEAIANRVERALRMNADTYSSAVPIKAETIEWPEEQWRHVYDELKLQLLSIYGKRSIQISELAIHLAASITDDLLVDMIEKGRAGELPGRKGQPFDPIGVDMMPVEMRKPMMELIALLEAQMAREQFWEVDEKTLGRIGQLICAMNEAYLAIIADELIRDELEAAPIPKGDALLFDEEWPDLPEID